MVSLKGRSIHVLPWPPSSPLKRRQSLAMPYLESAVGRAIPAPLETCILFISPRVSACIIGARAFNSLPFDAARFSGDG